MKIGFLGFGNMAQAMAGGFVRPGAVQPGDSGACARDREILRRQPELRICDGFDDTAADAAFAHQGAVASNSYQIEVVSDAVRVLLA